jgi:hypothetical protein
MKILIDECLPDALKENLAALGTNAGRRVSILILCARSNRMRDLLPLMPACAEALLSIEAGRIVEIGPL